MGLMERFDVDPRRVVHETIGGETIVIQLETGTYYSLGGSGQEIWTMLAGGWSEDEVVAEMRRLYPDSQEVVGEAASAFARDLVREKLLTTAAPNGNWHPPAGLSEGAPGRLFEAPVLQKYTDLEYFLLLDPVHEVDNTGCPNERADAASGNATSA